VAIEEQRRSPGFVELSQVFEGHGLASARRSDQKDIRRPPYPPATSWVPLAWGL